jgi:hypothetical protein
VIEGFANGSGSARTCKSGVEDPPHPPPPPTPVLGALPSPLLHVQQGSGSGGTKLEEDQRLGDTCDVIGEGQHDVGSRCEERGKRSWGGARPARSFISWLLQEFIITMIFWSYSHVLSDLSLHILSGLEDFVWVAHLVQPNQVGSEGLFAFPPFCPERGTGVLRATAAELVQRWGRS